MFPGPVLCLFTAAASPVGGELGTLALSDTLMRTHTHIHKHTHTHTHTHTLSHTHTHTHTHTQSSARSHDYTPLDSRLSMGAIHEEPEDQINTLLLSVSIMGQSNTMTLSQEIPSFFSSGR